MASTTRRGSPAGAPPCASPGLAAVRPAAIAAAATAHLAAADGRPAGGWLAAAGGGRGAIAADPLQRDGDVRERDIRADTEQTWKLYGLDHYGRTHRPQSGNWFTAVGITAREPLERWIRSVTPVASGTQSAWTSC